jgi:hypothetical protein
MEAADSPKILVNSYCSAQHHMLEDSNENFRSPTLRKLRECISSVLQTVQKILIEFVLYEVVSVFKINISACLCRIYLHLI